MAGDAYPDIPTGKRRSTPDAPVERGFQVPETRKMRVQRDFALRPRFLNPLGPKRLAIGYAAWHGTCPLVWPQWPAPLGATAVLDRHAADVVPFRRDQLLRLP
jgi:hypothetical protein